MALPIRRLTFDDLRTLPEDGWRHELVEGELIVSPAPTPLHQLLLYVLYGMMRTHVVRRRLGVVFGAPIDVKLSEFSGLQPDICFVMAGRRGVLHGGYLVGPPDLVVEIVSPSSIRLDLRAKRDIHERFGVREYWVLDPEARRLLVHRLVDDRYQTELDDQRMVRSLVIDGFVLDVPALFDEVDRELDLLPEE